MERVALRAAAELDLHGGGLHLAGLERADHLAPLLDEELLVAEVLHRHVGLVAGRAGPGVPHVDPQLEGLAALREPVAVAALGVDRHAEGEGRLRLLGHRHRGRHVRRRLAGVVGEVEHHLVATGVHAGRQLHRDRPGAPLAGPHGAEHELAPVEERVLLGGGPGAQAAEGALAAVVDGHGPGERLAGAELPAGGRRDGHRPRAGAAPTRPSAQSTPSSFRRFSSRSSSCSWRCATRARAASSCSLAVGVGRALEQLPREPDLVVLHELVRVRVGVLVLLLLGRELGRRRAAAAAAAAVSLLSCFATRSSFSSRRYRSSSGAFSTRRFLRGLGARRLRAPAVGRVRRSARRGPPRPSTAAARTRSPAPSVTRPGSSSDVRGDADLLD